MTEKMEKKLLSIVAAYLKGEGVSCMLAIRRLNKVEICTLMINNNILRARAVDKFNCNRGSKIQLEDFILASLESL